MTALHDKRSIWMRMHLDLPLLIALLIICLLYTSDAADE